VPTKKGVTSTELPWEAKPKKKKSSSATSRLKKLPLHGLRMGERKKEKLSIAVQRKKEAPTSLLFPKPFIVSFPSEG